MECRKTGCQRLRQSQGHVPRVLPVARVVGRIHLRSRIGRSGSAGSDRQFQAIAGDAKMVQTTRLRSGTAAWRRRQSPRAGGAH
eukprot:1381591-Prymnesium_polylepis.1